MLERGGPLIAMAVVLAGLLLVLPDTERELAVPTGPEEPGLLEAWERSRTVEVVVDSEFTRTFPDGRELAYEQRLVQRPPDDRLVIGAGSASGRIDGQIVRCNAVADGSPECVEGGEAPPYDEVVAAEVVALGELVDPDTGVYEVDDLGDGCFDLVLRIDIPSPPYGVAAGFCFDEASGALAEVVIERDEAVDRSVAVEIRTEVTPADLRADDIGEPISG